MNRTGFWILIAATLLFFAGCRKITPDPNPVTPVNMDDLKVAPGFSWATSRDVLFQITAENSVVVAITSEDGIVQYHKGFYSQLQSPYEVTVSLPSCIQKVLVNGEPVAITGSIVPVSLIPKFTGSFKNAAGNPGYQIPTQGLLAAWQFDENSGTTAHDLQGLHDGTISGATWVPGINGSALEFDGLGARVLVPNNATFNPVGDKLSVSFWFRLSQVGTGGAFIFQNVKYMVRMDAQGRVGFAVYTPLWNDIVMTYADRILDTDWHHVAATYDGSMLKLYLDNVLKASGANTGTLHSVTSNVIIGTQNTMNFLKGTVDEMLVYDRALSEAEIGQLFTTTPDPGNGSADLISEWKLNEGSGTVANDSKGTSNGTISDATWGTGMAGSCLNFNGTSSNVKILNAPALNPVNEFTMMAWAKTLENKTCKIMQKGDWDGHGIGQGKWDGWNVHVRLSDNTSHSLHWLGGLPIVNEWYHLAMTYDGTTLKMYVNGQLKNTTPLTGALKVNGRDFSIGSDNAAQKFFNGSIDEVKYFSRALTQTEIQANFNDQGSAPDSDGDGVPNADDSYPDDPARAFNNPFPAAGFGSLAFEDLWPGKGDYDFNDLVVDYRFNVVTNGNNKVTEVLTTFAIRAIGAGFANGFGFQLPGSTIQPSDVEVEGSLLLEDYITLNPNGTEAGQEKITIIVFDNVNKIMPSPSGFGVNVVPGAPYVDPDTVIINIGLTPDKYTLADLGLTGFNPFLIVDKERGKEVHLPDYPPTSLVNTGYFGTGQDDSDPATGKYYKTSNNLPWAISIASSYDYTIESAQITSAYLKFASWAESSGSQYPDWYLGTAGYRDEANIYQVP